MAPQNEIHRGTRIGHVHLKVADLERSLKFYQGVMGFRVTQHFGPGAVFLAAGDYHHHIGLNTWESFGAPPAPRRAAGLYHVAILMPDRRELARMLKRLVDAQWPLEGAADHGVSESIYLSDPDGNGIEIYADRDPVQWPRDAAGNVAMVTEALDLEELLREADSD